VKKVIKLLPSIFFWFAIMASHVYATNGYWAHGYGAKSKSIAGACVAMAFDAMCANDNPASLAMVGNRLDYGLAFFVPQRGFTADDNASSASPTIPPGDYDSDNDFFLLPHIGYNYMINEKNALGIVVSGHHGGMNTEYGSAIFKEFANPDNATTVPTSTTGFDLRQMLVGVTYSRKITEQHALGITPIFAVQMAEVQGLQPFTQYSLHPQQVTNKGNDFSFGGGVRIGWLGKITDYLTLGASYQSRLWMTPFEDYKGLLAEEGDFDIPSTYQIGLAVKMMPSVTLAVDYQRIEYNSIKALGNSADLALIAGQSLLGSDEGLGFGWKNMDVIKVGVEWKYSPDLILRAGFSQANEAFPNSQGLFNILAPAVARTHLTAGFTVPLNEQVEFSVSFMYAPNETVTGSNPNTASQTGSLAMEQYELAMSWGIRF
jgi:long-chain fatty acid transport protein